MDTKKGCWLGMWTQKLPQLINKNKWSSLESTQIILKKAVIRYIHDCKDHTTRIYIVDWYRDALGSPGGYLGLPGSFWCLAVKSHASDQKLMLSLRIKQLSCFISSRRFGWCKLFVIPPSTINHEVNCSNGALLWTIAPKWGVLDSG